MDHRAICVALREHAAVIAGDALRLRKELAALGAPARCYAGLTGIGDGVQALMEAAAWIDGGGAEEPRVVVDAAAVAGDLIGGEMVSDGGPR